MAIATFHQLLAAYDEQLKSSFPGQGRMGLLAIITSLKDGPLTEKELIQRTGMRQPRVNRLIKRARALGLVTRSPSHNRKARLTEDGKRRMEALDAALATVLARTAVMPIESAKVAPIAEKAPDNSTPAPQKATESGPTESEEVRHQKRFAKNFKLD